MNSGYCLHHIASSVFFFRLDYRSTCHNNLNMIINELTSMWNNSKRHTWQRLVCALVNCESKARILQTALAAIWIPRRASFLSINSSVRWCSMSLTGKHHKIDTNWYIGRQACQRSADGDEGEFAFISKRILWSSFNFTKFEFGQQSQFYIQ